MEPPHILCINLADAKERWKSIQHQVANHLPHWPLHRIEATHWRNLPPQLQGIPMTPFTRYLVLNAERQTVDRISHRQMDTVSSVAIVLSHIACWQWMVEHPEVPAVLILEDDACFEGSHFTATILETVQPLLSPKLLPLWDALMLGYFRTDGKEQYMKLGDVAVQIVPQFFGAHAYMLTRSGVQALLQHVYPIEEQVDGYLLTMEQLGLLRMYNVPRSVVSQCMDTVQREGSFHTHTITSSTSGTIQPLYGKPCSNTLSVCLVVCGLFVLCISIGLCWLAFHQLPCQNGTKA